MSATGVLTRGTDRRRVVEQYPARLRLGSSVSLPGTEQTGGVWWPRSLDLVRELGPLLSVLGSAGHQPRRVTYNLNAWQPVPSTLSCNGSRVRLGGYRHLSPRVLHLTSSDLTAPLVLLVLPPSIDPLVAATALSLVSQEEG